MNKLEEAIKFLENLRPVKYWREPMKDGRQEEDIELKEVINIVLQELSNLQEKNQTLIKYIGKQGLISDYMRHKNSKNK